MNFKTILRLIDQRLKILSTKPRRINYHRPQDAYCLQYEERLAITNRNLRDQQLYEDFVTDTKIDANAHLTQLGVSPEASVKLIEDVLHTLFAKQGLEFSDFVIHTASQDAFEKNLPELISEVVEKSSIIKAKAMFKNALLITLRNMIYNGTPTQKQFLTRLCHTYMLMFLLQCEPQLATYFQTLAGRLTVYVDASILVPAISEHFLEERHQRYASLLRGAMLHGTKIVINEPILNELATHLQMVDRLYQRDYLGNEELYTEESAIFLVDQIILRAFFYARMRKQVHDWGEFLGAVVSPGLRSIREDLVQWLKEEFGIDYIPNESIGVQIDNSDVNALTTELAKHKVHATTAGQKLKARNDANVILTVYQLRQIRNELGTGSVFGYSTWWLTSDITTYKAVKQVFGDKYQYDCYMRPDFLYNFISLAPLKAEADEVFLGLFPTLVGVNISFHVPEDVSRAVHNFVVEHQAKNGARVKSTIRELVDNLKSNPTYWTRNRVTLFLAERKKRMLAP